MTEAIAEVISLDAFRLFGIKVNIANEPDECPRPFHRYKYIQPILASDIADRGCIKCGTACILNFHPSMSFPRWHEVSD